MLNINFLDFNLNPNQGIFLFLGFIISLIVLKDKETNLLNYTLLIITSLFFGFLFYPLLFKTNDLITTKNNSILGSFFGILILFIFLKRRLNLEKLNLDKLILPIPIIQIFGKIGCYFGNCCLGSVDIFKYIIPLQFFESFCFLIIYTAINYFKKNNFIAYLTLFLIFRILFELFRIENYNLLFGFPIVYLIEIVSLAILLKMNINLFKK